jgi:FkbM family methyltransferase
MRGVFLKLYQGYYGLTSGLNKNKIILAEVGGIKYRLDLSEMIDSAIYYEGCFEPFVTSIIQKKVNKGMYVLDIGANIGCHTLPLAKIVGEQGKVFAFEPMSRAFSKLKQNVGLNSFKNIVLEKIAFSDVSQKKDSIHFRSSWPLDSIEVDKQKEKEEVEFTTLDDYVKKNNIQRIDFMKLDVDGYECKIVKGGMNALKKFRPMMIIELGISTLKGVGDEPDKLIDSLMSLGYSFFSEKELKPYPGKDSILKALPPDGTINVYVEKKI